MPSDTFDPKAPETAPGKHPPESAPTTSDSSFPKQRSSGQFGTHGGPLHMPSQSPKASGKHVK